MSCFRSSIASLLTSPRPRRCSARAIARSEADMARQGEALLKLGPRAVLMKGGHLDSDEAIDVLVTEGAVHRFAAPKLPSKNLHGSGCVLSSAIAAYIARGAPLSEACRARQGVRAASD